MSTKNEIQSVTVVFELNKKYIKINPYSHKPFYVIYLSLEFTIFGCCFFF